MKIKYSPDADALIIGLKNGKIVDSEDISECIIVHYSEQKEPLEIEILDASKLVNLDAVDVSWSEMLKPKLAVA